MATDRNMLKKSVVILMNLARDLFLLDTGQQIPTILDYTDRFSVSRGIVQTALETLQKDGSIRIEKRGVLGTYLEAKDDQKLYRHTGWDSVTGTMPIPLTPYFVSLTTGICEALADAPMDFSFAYMTGSSKRAETLHKGVYDFMIASRSAAMLHVKEYDDLEICRELKGAIYSKEYRLYFMDPKKKEIENGMRVGVDPVCMDQRILTERLCRKKKVEIVEFPFIGFEDIAKSGKVDCIVFRDIEWSSHAKEIKLNEVPITGIRGFRAEDMNTPVVLVRKDNYAIDRLFEKYLDAEKIRQVQQEVLEGKRTMKFY